MNTHNIAFLDELIVLESEVLQQTAGRGQWTVTFSIISNTIGPIELFVVNEPLQQFMAVASPMLEDATPVAPSMNAHGEQRISEIRFIHAVQQQADDAVSGVINDLDEYLRSKVVFRDQMTAQTLYTFVPVNG